VTTSMRILCLTQWFTPEPESSRGLPFAKWLQEQGHEVTVLTGFPNYPSGVLYPGYRLRLRQWDEVEGVRVLRVPLYPNHDRSAFRRTLNYLSFAAAAALIGLPSAGAVDVIYAMSTPPTTGLPPLLKKVFQGVPYLINITDIYPESITDSGMVQGTLSQRLFVRLAGLLCNSVYGGAAFVTVISDGFKKILVERGLPEEKIHTVYNSADEGMFHPVPGDAALARELGLEGRFNLIYAGNFGPYQKLDTIIRAAALLQNVPEVQIVLVGSGQLEGELRELAAALKLKNVRFISRVEQHRMPQIYGLADGLLIHLVDRPFLRATVPGKTQTSLAVGRPIIVAARGECADIIGAAGGGFVCDPEDERALADQILRLFQTPKEERELMGRRARAYYLDHFSLHVGAQKIEELLKRAVSQAGDNTVRTQHEPAL
jgi:colanic acid biosynthesis glycosyl transferase WcaI